MLKTFLFFLFTACLTLPAAGQFKSLKENIPEHFNILDSASGDIDRDGLKDLVVVLRNEYEKQNSDTTRPLLLLKGNGTGQYALMARNDSVVLCLGCGGIYGDPFETVTIKEGMFSVHHAGGSSWRWTRTITFSYQEPSKHFVLQNDTGESWHVSDPAKTTATRFNEQEYGKVEFERYSNSLDR
jgi:hypothetical protein